MPNDSANTTNPSPSLPLPAQRGEGGVEGAPSVQAEVKPSTAKLGDLLTLDIRVKHSAALTVEPPAFQKNLGAFEVYASTQLPPEVRGSEITNRFQAQLQNFTTGPQLLPGVEVTYQDINGKPHQLSTPQLQVTIEEVPPGPHDKGGNIRGIKGVIGPVAWSSWWWLLFLALAAAIAWTAWINRKRIVEGPPPPPPMPPDQEALQRLEELLEAEWVERGKIKEFYSGLSEILRAYLERGFRIPALERTTNELMRDVVKHKNLEGIRPLMRELLETCDFAKFAKHRPSPEDAKKDHAAAVKIVEQTRDAFRQP